MYHLGLIVIENTYIREEVVDINALIVGPRIFLDLDTDYPLGMVHFELLGFWEAGKACHTEHCYYFGLNGQYCY